MEIIDHMNISLSHISIFRKFPTFSYLVHLSHYQSIQETKYKDHDDSPPKVSFIFVSQYIKSLIKDS